MTDLLDDFVKKGQSVSDTDINKVVSDFLERHHQLIRIGAIKSIHKIDDLAKQATKERLREVVRNSVISYLNNNSIYTTSHLEKYMLGAAQNGIRTLKKENSHFSIRKVCPACKYFGLYTAVTQIQNKLGCSKCSYALKNEVDKSIIKLHSVFSEYSMYGYKCPDCDRFIPKPTGTNIISCPFPDCFFTGNSAATKKMSHPAYKFAETAIKVTEDSGKGFSLESQVISGVDLGRRKDANNVNTVRYDTESKAMAINTIHHQMKILSDIIKAQVESLPYTSIDSTLFQKRIMYQAFENVIAIHPDDMIGYLVHEVKNVGLQHKIFQEYVRIVESKLPFTFVTNGSQRRVKDLLDPSLNIFDGESVFESIVNEKYEVENCTTEMYIGSRKANYCRNYFIGKLLSVADVTGSSLMNDVTEYGFDKIIMKHSVKPGTVVSVRHLRVPPHYQMGAMVHVNRIRRRIVDKAHLAIFGTKRKLAK